MNNFADLPVNTLYSAVQQALDKSTNYPPALEEVLARYSEPLTLEGVRWDFNLSILDNQCCSEGGPCFRGRFEGWQVSLHFNNQLELVPLGKFQPRVQVSLDKFFSRGQLVEFVQLLVRSSNES